MRYRAAAVDSARRRCGDCVSACRLSIRERSSCWHHGRRWVSKLLSPCLPPTLASCAPHHLHGSRRLDDVKGDVSVVVAFMLLGVSTLLHVSNGEGSRSIPDEVPQDDCSYSDDTPMRQPIPLLILSYCSATVRKRKLWHGAAACGPCRCAGHSRIARQPVSGRLRTKQHVSLELSEYRTDTRFCIPSARPYIPHFLAALATTVASR